jgi:hypothetical protein
MIDMGRVSPESPINAIDDGGEPLKRLRQAAD